MNELVNIHIDVPIEGVYRRAIANTFAQHKNITIQFVHKDIRQYLNLSIAASIAGLVLGLARLIIAVRAEVLSSQWSLNRVKEEVQRAAAEFTGSDDVRELHFDFLGEFLHKEVDSCRVTADINDERYTFIVSRAEDTFVLKQEESRPQRTSPKR